MENKKHLDLTRYSRETLELYRAKLKMSIINKKRTIHQINKILMERDKLWKKN